VARRVATAREQLAAKPPSRDAEADALLRRAADRLHLSGRGYARVGRVARTIAALTESDSVRAEHVAEALSYRSPEELSP
jgi:magnesium chelatase family protein